MQDCAYTGRWGRKRENNMDIGFQIAVLTGFYKVPELHF